MIWDRRKLFCGLTRIKLTLCADKGLRWRRIFCLSTTSQALLRSIKDVVDGLLRSFSFSFPKWKPAIKRFLKGLHKSGLLLAARLVLKDSGSSSGISFRFFPTASREFLWRDEGKELMASLDKSSAIRMRNVEHLTFWLILKNFTYGINVGSDVLKGGFFDSWGFGDLNLLDQLQTLEDIGDVV